MGHGMSEDSHLEMAYEDRYTDEGDWLEEYGVDDVDEEELEADDGDED